MSRSQSGRIQVPDDLREVLLEFTISYLLEQPEDVVDYAADYFQRLRDSKRTALVYDENGLSSPDDLSHEEEPPVGRFNTRRKSVFAEAYDPEADEDDGQRVVHPKSDEQRRRLLTAVRNILLFRALDEDQMQEVIDAMFERTVQAGDMVIKQGDDGDNFYVIQQEKSFQRSIYINESDLLIWTFFGKILSDNEIELIRKDVEVNLSKQAFTSDAGIFHVFVSEEGGEPKHIHTYENSGSFGELALMYNMPRAATIKAVTEGSLWAMDRQTFRRILLKSAFRKRKMYETLIESVPMLKTLQPYERMNLADALVPRTYPPGEQIIKKGDAADGMFFVEDGVVIVSVLDDSGKEVEINRVGKGGYFGELALVTHRPRAANVFAEGEVKVAFLDVEAFERLLGPCMEIMKRNITDYEEQMVNIFGSKQNMRDIR